MSGARTYGELVKPRGRQVKRISRLEDCFKRGGQILVGFVKGGLSPPRVQPRREPETRGRRGGRRLMGRCVWGVPLTMALLTLAPYVL